MFFVVSSTHASGASMTTSAPSGNCLRGRSGGPRRIGRVCFMGWSPTPMGGGHRSPGPRGSRNTPWCYTAASLTAVDVCEDLLSCVFAGRLSSTWRADLTAFRGLPAKGSRTERIFDTMVRRVRRSGSRGGGAGSRSGRFLRRPVRIDNKLLGGAFVEVLIPLRSVIQRNDGRIACLGGMNLVVQDGHHQLAVVT
jgi:hypothetical protein